MLESRVYDVLVAGAGPAGVAAAWSAAQAGVRVGMVDDNPAAGGQVWRGGESGTADRGARLWLRRLRESPVEVLAESRILGPCGPGALLVERSEDAIEVKAERVVLATGARERFLPFPGWTLPNVTGAGGLQALVKAGLSIQRKKVAVAGSGPLLLAVAASLKRRGAEVVLVAEQASSSRLARFGLALLAHPGKLMQGAGLWSAIRGRYLISAWPVEARGGGKLSSVVFQTRKGRLEQPCDYLACGFGLVPNIELAALLGCEVRQSGVVVGPLQETTVEGVYCAGEAAGAGGLDLALTEGRIAGLAAAGQAGRARRLFFRRARERRFQRALERAFGLREELKSLAGAGAIVCRCEDVTFGKLKAYGSWRAAKLQTRCGMGPCQGRICGPATEFLLGWSAQSFRPPIFPARAASLSELE